MDYDVHRTEVAPLPLERSLKVPSPHSCVVRNKPSSLAGFQECWNDPTTGQECLWCLQWDCQPGYFYQALPYCYSYTWSPNDDYRAESDIYVEECSNFSCCADYCENVGFLTYAVLSLSQFHRGICMCANIVRFFLRTNDLQMKDMVYAAFCA